MADGITRMRCAYKDCPRVCEIKGQEPGRTIESHRLGDRECPGSGYNIDMSVVGEVQRMVQRAEQLGF